MQIKYIIWYLFICTYIPYTHNMFFILKVYIFRKYINIFFFFIKFYLCIPYIFKNTYYTYDSILDFSFVFIQIFVYSIIIAFAFKFEFTVSIIFILSKCFYLSRKIMCKEFIQIKHITYILVHFFLLLNITSMNH